MKAKDQCSMKSTVQTARTQSTQFKASWSECEANAKCTVFGVSQNDTLVIQIAFKPAALQLGTGFLRRDNLENNPKAKKQMKNSRPWAFQRSAAFGSWIYTLAPVLCCFKSKTSSGLQSEMVGLQSQKYYKTNHSWPKHVISLLIVN